MPLDVIELKTFYDTALGQTVRGLVSARLREMIGGGSGGCAVGLGFTTPFLETFGAGAERVLALMPARMGVCRWPVEGGNRAALVEEDELPLPDASVDRLLLIHGIEEAEAPEAMVREIWRVLAPGGRLIAVVPNRRGLWAQADSTPFGNGRPYSRGQLERLLTAAKLAPTGWSEALFLPPLGLRAVVGSARALEKIGRSITPAFSGLILVEAEKRMWQALPSDGRALRVPRLVPAMADPVSHFARRRRRVAAMTWPAMFDGDETHRRD